MNKLNKRYFFVDSLLVILSLCLFATNWSLAPAHAGVYAGYTCLNIVGGQTCAQTGDTACQYLQGGNPNNCKGACTYCLIDTYIGNSVCVVTEATESCTTTTGYVWCGAGIVKVGACAKPNGVCNCLYGTGTASCVGGPWYYYRCATAANSSSS